MKFKKGDKVFLKPRRYSVSSDNPINVVGTVIKYHFNKRLEVKWENKEQNNYSDSDLILASKLAKYLFKAADEAW
jgi:hypothetical protein